MLPIVGGLLRQTSCGKHLKECLDRGESAGG